MPKSLLPPEGFAYVSAHVMFNLGLPPVVRDTYAALRMLAWGATETPELSWAQIIQYTGKGRPTVYRHMLTLVNKGVIHWRAASVGTVIVTFTDGLCLKNENSQKREMPFKALNPKQEPLKAESKSPRLKNENSQKRDKPPMPNYYPLAEALAEVCHMDLNANRGRLFAEAKRLASATPAPTPDLLRQHYNGYAGSYWRAQDWRGKQGQDPSPATIRETWGKWLSAGLAHQPAFDPHHLTPEQAALKAQLNARKQATHADANH